LHQLSAAGGVKINSYGKTAFAPDERGIAFVVSLVTMLILVVLGYGVLVATDGSTRAENSLKAQTTAFETADAGIERARETLRACLAGTATSGYCATKRTISDVLNNYRNGTTLVDSTSLANFGSTTATANGTGNTPFLVDSTLLAPSAFQVFLTNDPADGVTNKDDGASGTPGFNRVTLTSFASGPNSIGYAVVQAVVQAPLSNLDDLFQATLVLPGPDIVTDGMPNSNPYHLSSGGCVATIAVTSNAARTTMWNAIPSGRRDTGHYNDGCSPNGLGVYNFLPNPNNPYPGGGPSGGASDPLPPTGPPAMPTLQNQNLITISWYQNTLLPTLSAVANFRSTSDAGFTLGTTTNPQVVYIDGNYDMGPGTGAGVLVVTGNLVIHGNPTYTGLILAVGAGNITFNGGGMGAFSGTMLAVNTTPWSGNASYVSAPTFNANGGGNASWGFGGNTIQNIPFNAIASPRRISFLQLR
jgi:Tfp pilus assembly protein PilX